MARIDSLSSGNSFSGISVGSVAEIIMVFPVVYRLEYAMVAPVKEQELLYAMQWK